MLIKNMHSILAELTRYSGASEQYLVTERAWSWFSLQSNALSASQPATHWSHALRPDSQVRRLPPIRPIDDLLILIDIPLELAQLPLSRPKPIHFAKVHTNVIELKDHVDDLGFGRDDVQDLGNVGRVGPFTDGHGVVFGKRVPVHFLEEFDESRSVGPLLIGSLPGGFGVRDGCVGEGEIFGVEVASVDAGRSGRIVEVSRGERISTTHHDRY